MARDRLAGSNSSPKTSKSRFKRSASGLDSTYTGAHMTCAHSCWKKFFGLATATLMANCAFAALGQTVPAGQPGDCAAYASVPLPAEAEKATGPKVFPACASYRSYRGIGRAVNYADARACAWQERLAQKAKLGQNPDQPTSWVVGGSLILADLYVNGAGVPRNVPLAMRLACEAEESMAMSAMPEVEKPTSGSHEPFEFCDYAATTLSATFCSDYASEIKDERRGRYENALKSSMVAEQQAAFTKLLAARDAYLNAHAYEVNQEGSSRNLRALRSQEILSHLFQAELTRYERKQWPALSANQIATSDGLLQREYAKKVQSLRTQTKDEIYEGSVTIDGLSNAEKAWEAYRDAWVAFARVRYPGAVDAIRAQITLDRYRLVKTIS
ncbi:lysozyme inhibitor LprI family protein [Terriglobus albidus]|uniref:lysozyme inhibitor LprI family protein n=1 Tax=Terriglobus albidus TaxID=1592106 RepID=UPI0021E047BB|nr:hypothetical protein [Terriglobus albidus]